VRVDPTESHDIKQTSRVIAFPFSVCFSKAAGRLHPEIMVTMHLVSEASAGEQQREHA
jgi:hypothetical protein